MSWNPKSVPKIGLKLSFNNTHIIQFISKEKRSLMSGCTKYKKTTFTTCIVRHIVNEVGCKVSSNKYLHQSIQGLQTFQIPFYGKFLSIMEQENCTKIGELRQHLQFWFTLSGKETFGNMFYTVNQLEKLEAAKAA